MPLEPISRRKFLNAIHESPWDRNVVQRKVAIEARQTEPTVNLGMDKEGLQLRAEEQIVILARNVKWFDPHAVTGQHDALPGLAPERDRKHSPQFGKTVFVPLQERAQHRFRVGVRFEAVPQVLQFGAQLEVVVNLSVEDDSSVAVFGQDGLIALSQVDDFQACCAQGKEIRLEDALLIGPAVDQRSGGLSDSFRRRAPTFSGESGNPTQCSSPVRLPRRFRAVLARI